MDLDSVSQRNKATQPKLVMPVFNNSNVCAEGWYFACKSTELKVNQTKSIEIANQNLVIWRSESKNVYALDAYCPHMGTHLAKGKVIGENIRCFFHHWQYDGEGQCKEIPAAPEACGLIKANSYLTTEKYGAIWIFPKNTQAPQLASYDELEGADLIYKFDQGYNRECHHHVNMINGLDPQHLKTVHNIQIEMSVELKEHERQIEVTLTGPIGEKNFSEKLARFFLGKSYSYSMKYDHASVGFLTIMKNVFWLGGIGGKRALPRLYMIFAYRPLTSGGAYVQPIFLTKKRTGLLGLVISQFLLLLTKMAFRSLQGEDGEVYDNMRFNPRHLLPIDGPVANYIRYVNKLPISQWSAK
jgi:phenylpropionate dioxygenase-like ring-hydroxylating dioxygenase large terminal subunit